MTAVYQIWGNHTILASTHKNRWVCKALGRLVRVCVARGVWACRGVTCLCRTWRMIYHRLDCTHPPEPHSPVPQCPAPRPFPGRASCYGNLRPGDCHQAWRKASSNGRSDPEPCTLQCSWKKDQLLWKTEERWEEMLVKDHVELIVLLYHLLM